MSLSNKSAVRKKENPRLSLKLCGVTMVFLLWWWFSCTAPPDSMGFDNPLDPSEEDYIPPETVIIEGPLDGAIVDSHTVVFSWEGSANVSQYSHRLNSASWSNWSTITSVALDYLDEGNYLFEVKGRYATGTEDSTAAFRNFTIDDIHGPALWFSPRYISVGNSQDFTLTLFAEDVTDLMAVLAQIQFDPGTLELSDYQILDQAGDFLVKNSGSILTVVDATLDSSKTDFNLAVVNGSPPGLDGSGALLTLVFSPRQRGMTEIVLTSECTMISSSLAETSITELVPMMVEVR